ncbi:hypothetical protein MLD38_036473 [Melastoma candidum]|uniref:Uncharacterized protein n=1 Tax=Melastoma candidum TaxID=119954 RepID=A0ACB9LJU5_9MYRT|nr:hypothetical protein MLD38_036473 [Melastoma candidum]
MGVGGKFWDVLKPYGKQEGHDFLRDKWVAVDLSYWVVQHETALKKKIGVHGHQPRNPHLRLTFFRTLNLFSKFGAFPIFVVDGTPSPLKSKARILRFFQASGIDRSSSSLPKEGLSVERNRVFNKCVRECVELLKLLGIPVLKAKGEAEALCAQLNKDGHVDACITADSDAFLFGAKCVIKCIHPNSREPFECYCISDIEGGLGLKRNHLIAISLLVGNDHDLGGVRGIGIETAIRFTSSYSEDEILNRLIEMGNRDGPFSEDVGLGCMDDPPEKPIGFKCNCSSCSCEPERKLKEQKKKEIWKIKVCNRIICEPGFPKTEIIEMYLGDDNGYFPVEDGPCLSWERLNEEMVVEFLVYHQNWEPSYVRQKLLMMHSTLYLREAAATKLDGRLLCGKYEFNSIKRVKVRNGVKSFVVKWMKPASIGGSFACETPDRRADFEDDVVEMNEMEDNFDEPDEPQVYVDDGCCFLLTDEHMDLVKSAFPEEVRKFFAEKEQKDSSRRKSGNSTPHGPRSTNSKSRGVQTSITEFFRSTKVGNRGMSGDITPGSADVGASSKVKRKDTRLKPSKSVRRRLLFG